MRDGAQTLPNVDRSEIVAVGRLLGGTVIAFKKVCGCLAGECADHGRRRFLWGAAALAGLGAGSANAQELWTGAPDRGCDFYGAEDGATSLSDDIYTFMPTRAAREVVEEIVAQVGLPQNFSILAANVPNAAAVIRDSQRYILYSEAFMAQITSSTATEWAAKTILAHEVGHHLAGHTIVPGGSRPPTELEADSFAGFAVGKMGATLAQAQSPFRQMSEAGSPTHPPRSARLEAVSVGWRRAVPGDRPARTEPGNRNDRPSIPEPLNPATYIAQVLEQLRTGTVDFSVMDPSLAALVRQQLPFISAQLQNAGPIANIRLAGQQPMPGGIVVYYFDVFHTLGPARWVLSIRNNNLVVGLGTG